MSRGTRPLGWLFNFFSRQPQGNPYEVLESVQPVQDVSQDWPLPLQFFSQAIVTAAGNTQLDIVQSNDKHRLWVNFGWASPDVLVYQPAVPGSFSVVMILSGTISPPVLFYMTLDAAAVPHLKNPEQVPFCGSMNGALTTDSQSSRFVTGYKCGNIYQPPGSTLRLLWTQQTITKTINLRGFFIERDANAPLCWPF